MDYISDPAIRTRTGAPLLTPWSARGMSNAAYASQTAKDAHTALVHIAISQAEQTPTFAANDSTKSAIVSKIQELVKRLQILQKLFSGNPKGMAQALTQIFKELRGLLKQFKQATGQEFSGADAASTQVTTPAPTPSDTDSTTTTTPDDPTSTSDSTTPAIASASYAEVDQGLREAIGKDGLQFLDTLRGLLSTIDQKMLTPARLQHIAHKSDKDEDQSFKDMDEQLTKLKKEMSDMQDDIHQAAPTLGTQLSVTA